ncbi:MAG: prepilin-type N-terminal cleavage/methylation domain-containing protein [Gemmatimonadota bacterium]
MSGADSPGVNGGAKDLRGEGFTLVEVLMALLLLAGVAPALLMLGTRTTALLHATAVQRDLLAMAAQVTDSLRLHRAPGTGERRAAGGTVTWVAMESGGVLVEALLDPGPGRPGVERVTVYQAYLADPDRGGVEP